MALFCVAIRRDSVFLLKFLFLWYVPVFSCETLSVCRLKYQYFCFSSHFCFLIILQFIMVSVLFLFTVINLCSFLCILGDFVLIHLYSLQCWWVLCLLFQLFLWFLLLWLLLILSLLLLLSLLLYQFLRIFHTSVTRRFLLVSPQMSRTLLSSQLSFNSAVVWMVSIPFWFIVSVVSFPGFCRMF